MIKSKLFFIVVCSISFDWFGIFHIFILWVHKIKGLLVFNLYTLGTSYNFNLKTSPFSLFWVIYPQLQYWQYLLYFFVLFNKVACDFTSINCNLIHLNNHFFSSFIFLSSSALLFKNLVLNLNLVTLVRISWACP